MAPESYVVRIYRREKLGEVIGQIERVKDMRRHTFHSLAELNAILTGMRSGPGALKRRVPRRTPS